MAVPLIPAAAFLAKYATPILAGTGAIFGAKEGYEQSGGNVGSALLGAGTGALGLGALPGVGRRLAGGRVGQTLTKGAVESGLAGKTGQLVDQLSGKGALASSPLAQQMLGQQVLGATAAGGLTLAGLNMIPGLAGGIGATGAGVSRAVTGGATQAGSAGLGLLPDLELFGVPLGERAKRRREGEFQRGEMKKDLELQQQLQGQYLNKTLAPFLDSQRRAQVTAQQSLLNTQGAIYQKLARQAGNFQLAGQGIESNTRLAEASLTQNPYAGSVIQAPNITFGRG